MPLIISETGATATVGSRMQVPVALERFHRYARDATKSLGIPHAAAAGAGHAAGARRRSWARTCNRQPVGAVACISPYNFPLTNMAGKIAPALAVGLHRRDEARAAGPAGDHRAGRDLREVGFPPGVVNLVTSVGARARRPRSAETATSTWCRSPAPPPIGAGIYEAGGHTMKRMLLELGGKGAALVLDDADLDVAVTAIASVWGFHSGQICTAPTRAIVHRSKYDELVDRLAAVAGNMKVGDPLDEDTIVGPVISATQRDRIEGYVGAGGDEGADIVVDGRRPAHIERGYYVAPTLIAGLQARDEAGAGGDLRPGGRGRAVRRRRRSRSPSPTAPTSASTTT